ncbi:MAG: cbb3-type cytochrome c oxidase subunit I [Pseudomonadota bacterium]
MQTKSLRNWAIVSFVVSMTVLLVGGYYARKVVPPIPEQIVSEGKVLTTKTSIMAGQDVYQRYGLMDQGSIWGHGTLRGRDFSAVTLHKMGEVMQGFLGSEKTIREIKTNRYDPSTGTLTLPPSQAEAFRQLTTYWDTTFSLGEKEASILPNSIADREDRENLAHFFFWTAWAAGTQRPDAEHTYTNNWPPDLSVGNSLPPDAVFWSLFAIVALLGTLGLVIYLIHRYRLFYGEPKGVEIGMKLVSMPLVPSQIKAAKYFLVVGLLFVVQILNGGLLAHYTIHPSSFYIPQIAQWIPYNLSKTWHLQLAIFWIAVSWVGTAIYLAPVIGGKEPKGQGLLVDLLFGAILLVAVGSLVGEAISIHGGLKSMWFWVGHQGWEYLELGRLWQILLFVGLVFWLLIVYRALVPKLIGKEKDKSGLTQFYTLSAIAVVAFFAFGFFYGRGTHLTVADYWRWFVVHIWVESIFEFFGVAIISLFLVTLGLVDRESAVKVSYFTAIIVFLAGIIGTSHHYFWYGGPSFWLAFGGIFSSLEPVPLIVLVVRAWMEYVSIERAGKKFPYRWPLFFLTASSFWNFLGAGVFGFMINLPAINYYEHATYMTPNHGHTALFGVYGMLSIALLLFTWRSLVRDEHWNNKLLKISFWGLNGGLLLMSFTVLLPIGAYQVWKVVEMGFYWARSPEFYNLPLVQLLGFWRLVPDTIIIVVGALPLLYFLLSTYPKIRKG